MGAKPLVWPERHAPPKKCDNKTAAQRSKCRGREIPDRWVSSGREVLKVFQDGGVHPKATNDLHAAPARAVPRYSDRSRPSVGDEMLKSAGEPGSYHLLVGQQGQDREEDDAGPGEDPK